MTLAINSLGASALELEVRDKPDSNDHERFATLAEDRIRNHGEVNLLVRASQLNGWSPAALWQDLKFDMAHYSNVWRLGIVAEDSSNDWLATLSRPFNGAAVKFFPEDDVDLARQWVQGNGVSQPSP